MPLNKSTGNMYPWVTHTWNPIRGRCPHECSYCYMKRTWWKEGFRFVEKELKTRLSLRRQTWKDRKIFVGSSFDIFAQETLDRHCQGLFKVLLKIQQESKNQYFFQSKNSLGMARFYYLFPSNALFGTTIESDRDYPSLSKAPPIMERVKGMIRLRDLGFKTMVSIEPILDFDFTSLFRLIRLIRPSFVSIGADSKNHHLPEPPKDKVLDFINALKGITEVKIKDNLERIIGPKRPMVNKIDRDGLI